MEIRFTDLADESRVSDWFDPSDYSDVDEFREAVQEFAVEFAVHDEMDSPVAIPRFTLLSDILELAEDIEDYYDISAIRAYTDYQESSVSDVGGDLETIYEKYRGEFSSGADFAENWAEECGDYNSRHVSWPLNCIDWEAAWEAIEDDYIVVDDYYFWTY